MVIVADIIGVLDRLYPPELAQDWDAVGLVCGDPATRVHRVYFCVDVAAGTVDEALAWGADLLVAHHPLLLRGVTAVPVTTPKGRTLHRLIRAGAALFVAHTNADAADPGVSDALATRLGLRETRPLRPSPGRPTTGIGRIGELSTPVTLAELAYRVADRLPATAGGVRVAGDPDRLVRRVAVSGGAGDGYLTDAVLAGADAFLTADLRHHPVSEYTEAGGPALLDAAHWATEQPWLAQAAAALRIALAPATVEILVSELVTDPWTSALPSRPYVEENR